MVQRAFTLHMQTRLCIFNKVNHLENWKEYIYNIPPISSSWIVHQQHSIGTNLPIAATTPPSYVMSLIDNSFLTSNLNHSGGVGIPVQVKSIRLQPCGQLGDSQPKNPSFLMQVFSSNHLDLLALTHSCETSQIL
jgi:hypothetical protein